MNEAPNPESVEAQADPHDPEGIDAAAEAFAQKATQPINPEEEAPTDPEPEDEADTEATEADPEDAEPTEELAEVEYEGKTYSVPPELQKALLRQADYSRAMNEVSAKEKTYTARLEQVEAIAQDTEKYSESYAQVRLLQGQLQELEAVDWAQLENENPTEATRLALRQMRLQQSLNQAVEGVRSVGQKLQEERQRLQAEAKSEMDKALQKSLKGWGEELGTKLTQYATSNGVQLKTLHALTDPAMVIALDKARRFDELQASKTAIKAKVQATPPVTKPGQPRPKSTAQQDAMARLRKDQSIDAAAEAFLSRGR